MASSSCNVEHANNANGRQPLRALPPKSSNKRPSPITTAPSPPVTHAISKVSQVLTPPTTPPNPECRKASVSADVLPLDYMSLYGPLHLNPCGMEKTKSEEAQQTEEREALWEEITPRSPTTKFELIGSNSSGYEEYGRGVWSIVYRAVIVSDPEILLPALLTPPTSPVSTFTPPTNVKSILAIKAPARRDAHKILDSEARILTYLHTSSLAERYLVPFYGYDGPSHRILMGPVPLSLESHVKAAAKTARANFSTTTMFDPVIGISQWAQLATNLIAGLEFLHSRSCIHGDMKPANILLHPSSDPNMPNTYTPLYTDFSSSSITSSSGSTEQVSALTPDYTSPELLLALKGGTAFATPASDVFALAVTLLVAAIGESPYAGAKTEFQKLSMCREGKPLDFGRGGEQGSRVLKNREVSKVLEGAVKKLETRWSVEEWKEETGKVLESWMSPASTTMTE